MFWWFELRRREADRMKRFLKSSFDLFKHLKRKTLCEFSIRVFLTCICFLFFIFYKSAANQIICLIFPQILARSLNHQTADRNTLDSFCFFSRIFNLDLSKKKEEGTSRRIIKKNMIKNRTRGSERYRSVTR